MGWKARRETGVGRAKAALPKVRARPLERKEQSAMEGERGRAELEANIPLEHDDRVEERNGV